MKTKSKIIGEIESIVRSMGLSREDEDFIMDNVDIILCQYLGGKPVLD